MAELNDTPPVSGGAEDARAVPENPDAELIEACEAGLALWSEPETDDDDVMNERVETMAAAARLAASTIAITQEGRAARARFAQAEISEHVSEGPARALALAVCNDVASGADAGTGRRGAEPAMTEERAPVVIPAAFWDEITHHMKLSQSLVETLQLITRNGLEADLGGLADAIEEHTGAAFSRICDPDHLRSWERERRILRRGADLRVVE